LHTKLRVFDLPQTVLKLRVELREGCVGLHVDIVVEASLNAVNGGIDVVADLFHLGRLLLHNVDLLQELEVLSFGGGWGFCTIGLPPELVIRLILVQLGHLVPNPLQVLIGTRLIFRVDFILVLLLLFELVVLSFVKNGNGFSLNRLVAKSLTQFMQEVLLFISEIIWGDACFLSR
jgi:hypothetical protein